MILIPYEVLIFKTNQNKENVRRKLKAIVESCDVYSSLGFNRSSKPFIGEINQDDFKFIRGQGLGFNKITPLVFIGILVEKQDGTELRIKIRLRIWENLFLLFSVFLLLILVLERFELNFVFFPLLFYLGYLFLFNYYSHQSKRLIIKTFK